MNTPFQNMHDGNMKFVEEVRVELTKKELRLIQMVFDRINRHGGLADDGKDLLTKINFELLKR